MSVEYHLIVVSALLALSVIASKASGKLGVPALALFLIIGMLAGSEGPGGIHFDQPLPAQSLGVVALALILFAGGLSTAWEGVRRLLAAGVALATAGVLLTALLVGWFAVIALRFSLLEGLLLGAIISSTDAAAVFAVMRSRNISLRPRLRHLLELESGSNDPMAVFLTTGFIGLMTVPGATALRLFPLFVQQMAAGAILGYLLGRAMVFTVNRINLEYDGLYPVLTLTLVLFTYGATATLGGNGFLAVYAAGLVMGNRTFVHKNSLTQFHDGLAWLMQIAMFLVLGLLVFPSRLLPVASTALAVALFLMFVARPVGVLITVAPFRLPFREKVMVGWVGLRGAVPIILATYPLLAGLPGADAIFNVVFFVVLTSVLLQGPSLPWVAGWLRVGAPSAPMLRTAPALHGAALVEIPIPEGSPAAGKPIVALGLPRSAYIVAIQREDELIVPGGTTLLAPGDVLLMAGTPEAVAAARRLVEAQ
ncbi:MAG: potassium/proton antiporter [Armatimonadetes bacterium]|nr:potassium/proton antiporter [Armatimonadota bacterium]